MSALKHLSLRCRKQLSKLSGKPVPAQTDPDSRGGAAMVAEAYQRLLQKRWARELQLKNRGWFARFYRPSGRECHHKALESMAQGILYHYGWDHFAKEAAMLARNEQSPVVRVFVSIHVDLENPVCPNRFQTKLP